MPIWVTDVQCTTTTNVDAEGNVNTDVNEVIIVYSSVSGSGMCVIIVHFVSTTE